MKKFIAMSAIALAVAGCSESDDDPENVLGQVEISGTAEAGQTLTATVTDENGVEESAINYNWKAGDTNISGATSKTLTLTADHVGSEITVTATYTDNDDFAETANSSAVTVINQDATFAGDLTASVLSNATQDVTGTVTVTDADGADTVAAQTDTATTYGTFSITEAGVWTYTLDTSNATVAALADETEMLTDNVNIMAADGTSSTIEFTITGVAPDQVAKISDTDEDDTGELFFEFENGLNQGKLSLSILYGVDEEETAYISLYDSAGSTKSLIGELALNEGAFGLRVDASTNYEAIDAPDFTPGEWIDVEMTWNTTSTTEAGSYTITIDDVAYGPYESDNKTPGVLVESTTIRLASNGKLSADAVYINDYNIYSDEAGTTAILEEDFESYTVGDQLDSSNDDSPFGSRTFEAEVVIYGMETPDNGSGEEPGNGNLGEGDVAPGTPGNKVALIMDTMTDDAGELRYKLSTSDIINKGKLTASFYKSAASECTLDGAVKDAYAAVYGSSTSSYDAIVDLRIDGSDYDTDYAIRHKDEDGNKTVDIDNVNFTAETWTHIEITWDATAADTSTGPMVTVGINDTQVSTAAWASYSESLADVQTGAQTFVFKLGDTGANLPDCMYKVDNIKIFSTDDAGVDTAIFQDNFEGYEDGVSLDTDNSASPYHSNTAEAVVATEGS